jgi:hypothetical protein
MTLMYRVAAISGFLRPEATSSAIRRSVGIRAHSGPGGESRALRVGERLPPLGAQGAEDGGCFVEVVAALLRWRASRCAVPSMSRQRPNSNGNPRSRLGDDRGDRAYSRGRVVLGEPQGGFGAAGGDPRPRVVQAPRGLLQPGQPVGCAPREETSCPSFPAPCPSCPAPRQEA